MILKLREAQDCKQNHLAAQPPNSALIIIIPCWHKTILLLAFSSIYLQYIPEGGGAQRMWTMRHLPFLTPPSSCSFSTSGLGNMLLPFTMSYFPSTKKPNRQKGCPLGETWRTTWATMPLGMVLETSGRRKNNLDIVLSRQLLIYKPLKDNYIHVLIYFHDIKLIWNVRIWTLGSFCNNPNSLVQPSDLLPSSIPKVSLGQAGRRLWIKKDKRRKQTISEYYLPYTYSVNWSIKQHLHFF